MHFNYFIILHGLYVINSHVCFSLSLGKFLCKYRLNYSFCHIRNSRICDSHWRWYLFIGEGKLTVEIHYNVDLKVTYPVSNWEDQENIIWECWCLSWSIGMSFSTPLGWCCISTWFKREVGFVHMCLDISFRVMFVLSWRSDVTIHHVIFLSNNKDLA